tara:strand:+ start:305 stop:451 length:147 start_codon:yes stop_codon:yes gene_type:complete
MNKLNLLFLLLFLSGCNKEYINWQLGNLEDATIIANNKTIMIDFYTDW